MATKYSTTYERRPNDLYPSPPWVIDALMGVHDVRGPIWECAAGPERMLSNAMRKRGHQVVSTDITDTDPVDFLVTPMPEGCISIVTNPPYAKALVDRFVTHAHDLVKPLGGTVAMLLRNEFDCAKGRRPVFGANPYFRRKVVLTERLRIPGMAQVSSPMMNHSWYVWDFSRKWKMHEIVYV